MRTGRPQPQHVQIRPTNRLLSTPATAERNCFGQQWKAFDLTAATSRATELFLAQPVAEQRRLLHLVLRKGTWKGGELRMSLREPFEQLRLSNSATQAKDGHFGGE